jgi:hypothetical protein
LILVRAVHETDDFAVTLVCTLTRLRVTDFWTCVVLGLGRSFCGLLACVEPELNPPKTTPNSARRISRSAMTRWYALERNLAG